MFQPRQFTQTGSTCRCNSSNRLNLSLQFIEQARRDLFYTAFVAEVDAHVVGSASCQLFAGLYPNILTADYRQYGYIWGKLFGDIN